MSRHFFVKSGKTKPFASRPPRGWPVVATGLRRPEEERAHQSWRASVGLPEESPDFSDRDVFDIASALIERGRDLPARPDASRAARRFDPSRFEERLVRKRLQTAAVVEEDRPPLLGFDATHKDDTAIQQTRQPETPRTGDVGQSETAAAPGRSAA